VNPIYAAALEIQQFCTERRWRFCFIGGVAVPAQRSSHFAIGEGQSLLTCSAEDLIVFKAFAGREKDWLDIEAVFLRQAGRLREDQIWRELEPLLELKESPQTAHRLRALLERG
jgi:hypothetical protein